MKSESTQKALLRRLFTTSRRPFALRMAPMIDIIFLLLIFFLVAAKWRPEENFLPLRLPAADAQEQRLAKPEPLAIYILATETGCEVRIAKLETVQIKNNSIAKDLVVLMQKIKDCMAVQKRYATDPVEIVCMPDVKWEYLAKIYNLFYGAGLTDITFAMTEQPHDGQFD